MNENIERKVDMLISGMKLPKKKTRSRVITIATSLLIAIAIIASASFLGFYVQMSGTVDVEDLLWLDGDPIVETTISTETLVNVVPGCTATVPGGQHTLTLNSRYNGLQFSVYFHIEVTETTIVDETPVITTIINGLGPDTGGLLVTIWDITNMEPLLLDGGEVPQIDLNPGESVNFEIRVTADVGINPTSTYGYTIKLHWLESI